jgi:hypothetical protein
MTLSCLLVLHFKRMSQQKWKIQSQTKVKTQKFCKIWKQNIFATPCPNKTYVIVIVVENAKVTNNKENKIYFY